MIVYRGQGSTKMVLLRKVDEQTTRTSIVLEARRLARTYGEGELGVQALRGVDLRVEKGELLAIMGPSGSGKSTLLHLLGGVDAPTGGQVLLEEVDLATLSDDQRTVIRRQRIGFVFQSFNLLPTLTAEENVSLPLELDGVSSGEARRRALTSLELVGMVHRKTQLPSTLSGGEQQRVAIARALVIEPAIMLADEPTGNLDSANGRQVTSLLRRLSSGAPACGSRQTIVMVTHDQNVAAQADRLVCLRDGLVESDREQVPLGAAGERALAEEQPR
jgi:putative ABC transport system ATP-binding protein